MAKIFMIALGSMLILAFGALAQAEPPKRPPQQPPQRIVSVNLCTDQFVLALADREQIAGISRAAKDTHYSALVARAEGLPDHRGAAEEIVMMAPDLVVAGAYANRQTVHLLDRLGIAILNVPSVNRVHEIFPEIRKVADRIGRHDRGVKIANVLETRLQDFSVNEKRATGALYRPGGYVLGRDSIVDDVMRAAGLGNRVAELGIRGEDRLPLELLIMSPPDFLIIDSNRPERPSRSRRMLQHPALAKMATTFETLEFPVHYWLCATPPTVEGAEQLAHTITERLMTAEGRRDP
jgi:iron complex transport system substrate-binding protein